MRIWMLLIACVLVTGCFSPSFKDDLRCGPAGDCPPGMTCGTDDVCHGTAAIPPDALVIPDAEPVRCTGDAECQTPPNGCLLAGTCDLDTGVCDFAEVDCTGLDGECTTGMCEPATGTCIAVGANEDALCGDGLVCGAFNACGGFADGVCDSSGEQSRDCTRNACENGACVADAYVETAACTRVTEGVDCAADTVAGCGACGDFTGGTCDESGTQACQCTESKCASDVCTPVTTSCSQACARDTDGISCGSMTVTGCVPATCGYTSVCDESAPARACTCTTFTCVNGACPGSSAACSQGCTRVTDGDDCGCLPCGQLESERPGVCSSTTSGSCVGQGTCSFSCGL